MQQFLDTFNLKPTNSWQSLQWSLVSKGWDVVLGFVNMKRDEKVFQFVKENAKTFFGVTAFVSTACLTAFIAKSILRNPPQSFVPLGSSIIALSTSGASVHRHWEQSKIEAKLTTLPGMIFSAKRGTGHALLDDWHDYKEKLDDFVNSPCTFALPIITLAGVTVVIIWEPGETDERHIIRISSIISLISTGAFLFLHMFLPLTVQFNI